METSGKPWADLTPPSIPASRPQFHIRLIKSSPEVRFLYPSHREVSKSWIWFWFFKIFQRERVTSHNNFLRKKRLGCGSSLLWLFQPRSTLVISSKWSLEWIRPRNPSESLGGRGREEQSRLSCARFPRTCTRTCTRLRQTQTHRQTQTQTQTHTQTQIQANTNSETQIPTHLH